MDVIAKLPGPSVFNDDPVIQSKIDGFKSDLQSQGKEGDLRRSDISNKLEENRRLAVELKSKLADMESCSGRFYEAQITIIEMLHLLLDKGPNEMAGNNFDLS
jgi:hypothetical protein